MRRAIPFFFLLLYTAISSAQTNIPGGIVSGTWTTAGSPYLVQGNIMIANGTTLTIQPGVTVNFQGSYRMLVNGRLIAAGTVADSIRFTATDSATGWQGIRFDNTSSNNDSSVIRYCSIQYGISNSVNGGGIYVRNFSKLSIRNNAISNCWAVEGKGGGAIYLEGTSVTVSDNKIVRNHAVSGGGIYVSGGNPQIINNLISYNDNHQPPVFPDPGQDPDSYGGGVYVGNSQGATLSNNTITYNTCLNGGGFAQQNGTVVINNNTISYNQASYGGGIYANEGGQFRNNTISYNIADVSGGAAYCAGGSYFESNRIVYNTAARAGGGMTIQFMVSNVINNLIANNKVTSTPGSELEGGGGICVNGGPTAVLLQGNVIVNNSCINGGGLLIYGGSETMINNTIANNSAQKGGAMYCVNASSLELTNTILWGNTASGGGQQIFLSDDASDPSIRYSDVMGGQAGINANGNFYTGVYEDNIDADPLFSSPSGGSGNLFDGTVADWGLLNNSPAIDAGLPNITYTPIDYTGRVRVVNGRIDIGAIENQQSVPPTVTISGGGVVCAGAALPPVIFTFTQGTFPLRLVYSINGIPQPAVTGINTLEYIIPHAVQGIYTIDSISDPLSTGTGFGQTTVIIEQPSANFIVNNSAQCLTGNQFSFVDASSVNSGSINKWSWRFGDGATDSVANTSHSYNNAGFYSVWLIIRTANGCADTATKTVSVTAFSVNTLVDTVRTYNDSAVLNGGSGFAHYQWSNGDTTQTITVRTTGKYKVTVTNSLGCTASDSVYVEFRKLKTLFIDRVQNLCNVSSFPLSVKAKNLTNIIGLQGTLRWTSSVMTLDSVSFTNTAINITAANVNLSNKASGYITYSWNDNTLTGKTVADSTELFTLWFTKPGVTSATTQTVSFSSSPTAMEIDSINLSNNTPVLVTETSYINGSAGFRNTAALATLQLADCDSVIYNNQVFFRNSQLFDTVKYAGSTCDSVIKNVIITVYDTIVQPSVTVIASNTNINNGTTVTFTALISFGGNNPLIQWYKNGMLIQGQTGGQYVTNTLSGGDTVYAVLKSSFSCAPDSFYFSNRVGITVWYTVSGTIRGPLGATTRQPSVSITGSGNGTINTNGSGFYSTVLNGGPLRNYVLKPFKTNDLNRTNGVSTLDIAIIQSHILSATRFTSPYQWIAADVNRSGTVTSLDILLIQRLILGLNTSFNGNSVWTFVDTSGFDPLTPLQYRDSMVLNSLLTDKTNLNFTAIKLGDVNLDYNNTVARPNQPVTKPVIFYYDDIIVNREQTITIPVRVKDFKNVMGMQFTLGFNAAVLQFESIQNNRLNMQFASHRSTDGKLTFLWNDRQNALASLADGEILMELVFTAVNSFDEEDITVNSDITEAELWDGAFQQHQIVKGEGKIKYKNTGVNVLTAESFEVTPNPSSGPVQVRYCSLDSKNVSLELLSADGKILHIQQLKANVGVNIADINLKRLGAVAGGVYYLRLSGLNGGPLTKKLVVIK